MRAYLAAWVLIALSTVVLAQQPMWSPGAPEIVVCNIKTDVNIVSNLAKTTVEIHFKNQGQRQGEGELTLPLPQGVSVSRYALDINGDFREAVPIPKDKGTQVFQALETIRVDPGLLQKTEEGNSFKTRVFPIPAWGTRKIIIGYEEQLDLDNNGQFSYRMLSSYNKKICNFTLTITIKSSQRPSCFDQVSRSALSLWPSSSGEYQYSVTVLDDKPEKSISIRIPTNVGDQGVVTKSVDGQEVFYGFVRVGAVRGKLVDRSTGTVAVVWDSSLSCESRDLEKELQLLGDYLDLFDRVNVDLYQLGYKFKFDRSFSVNYGYSSALKRYLRTVKYDGATKIGELELPDKYSEVLFFTDGVSTLGRNKDIALEGYPRVFTINSQPTASHDFLNYLADKYCGAYLDLTRMSASEALKAFSRTLIRFLGIEDNPSIRSVYPQKGTPVLKRIFGIVGKTDYLPQNIVLKFGSSPSDVSSRITLRINNSPNDAIDAEKLWAQKAVEALERQYDDNKDQVDNLGSRYSIVTKGTSLIVLENVNDYVKYNVQPPQELRAEYDRIKKNGGGQEASRENQESKASEYWDALKSWWNNPKADAVSNKPTPLPQPIWQPQPPIIRPEPIPLPTPLPWLGNFGPSFAPGQSSVWESVFGRSPSATQSWETTPQATQAPVVPQIVTSSTVQASAPMSNSGNFGGLQTSVSGYGMGIGGSSVSHTGIGGSSSFGNAGNAIGIGGSSTFGDSAFSTGSRSVLGGNAVSAVGGNSVFGGNAFSAVGDSSALGGNSLYGSLGLNLINRAVAPPSAVRQQSSVQQLSRQPIGQQSTSASITSVWRPAPAPQPFQRPAPTPTPSRTTRSPCKKVCEWSTSSSYMNNIKRVSKSQAYDAYLSEREKGDNKYNPTFYIDVAEYFITFNRALALQILSNIADLSLESAYLYKALMYYFKQYEAFDDCLYAAKKINDWRPFEPQSHRDLALAYELVGNIDNAAKQLSKALKTTFYSEVANRVDGMQDSILMDVNRMASEYGTMYFRSLFDSKYLNPIPVDLRVVMTWNQPNVDLDLHVVDPRGEDCYYGNKRTAIGGRFSKDFTSGLGPEQYLLKTFVRGEYNIKSNYFAETKFTENGPTTVNVEIYQKRLGKTNKTFKTIQMKSVKENGFLSRIVI